MGYFQVLCEDRAETYGLSVQLGRRGPCSWSPGSTDHVAMVGGCSSKALGLFHMEDAAVEET